MKDKWSLRFSNGLSARLHQNKSAKQNCPQNEEITHHTNQMRNVLMSHYKYVSPDVDVVVGLANAQ